MLLQRDQNSRNDTYRQHTRHELQETQSSTNGEGFPSKKGRSLFTIRTAQEDEGSTPWNTKGWILTTKKEK